MPAVVKISNALKSMDETIFKRNNISSLLREFITDEELNELTSLDEPGVVWEKQEEFMLSISKVDSAKLKLQVWNFTFEFVENYDNIKLPINKLGEVLIFYIRHPMK